VTETSSLRVAALLVDGPAAARHARALGGFLRDGLRLTAPATPAAVTHVFLGEEAEDAPLVASAPTHVVRLVRTPAQRPDLIAAAIAAFHAGGGADLYLFPRGPLGSELAARLATRTGGSALTGVRRATLTADGLACERAAYSNHLIAVSDLGPRPWCVALDAAWDEAQFDPDPEHVVEASTHLASDDLSTSAPFYDAVQLEPPRTGDLEAARFLIVAGRGAGSRGGVERIAAAAARLGAAFGATRPVVMNGWAAPDRQIGVSGTRTAPAVCLVAGASGAPAFLWGVERAGFLAAVDSDDHSPIAGEADVLVVDDAVAVLEALADLVDADA
jgi:electron transfer flavoprotein alpha subunit